MAIPLVGSPPPAKNYENILNVDSSTFAAGVGSWSATGGAVTRDTTAGHRLGSLTASLKWASAGSTQVLSCALPGVFKAGVAYDLFLALKVEESPAGTRGVQVHMGVIGTDSANTQLGFGSGRAPHGNQYVAVRVRWVPTADRTGAVIRVVRTTTDNLAETFHIGYALVARAAAGGRLSIVDIPGISDQVVGGSFISGYVLRALGGPTGTDGAELNVGGSAFMGGPYGGTSPDRASLSMGAGATGTDFQHFAPHDVTGTRPQWGVSFEVGEDYIGFYMSEAAADEIEMYPDFGDYWITLLDGSAPGDTKGWRASDEAGNKTGLLSKAPLRSLAAAPSSPVAGEWYFDTVTSKARMWNGTTWNDLW